MPECDEFKPGYKFPFNACEVLCSDSSFVIDKIVEIKEGHSIPSQR